MSKLPCGMEEGDCSAAGTGCWVCGDNPENLPNCPAVNCRNHDGVSCSASLCSGYWDWIDDGQGAWHD